MQQLINDFHALPGLYSAVLIGVICLCYTWYVIWQEEREDKSELSQERN